MCASTLPAHEQSFGKTCGKNLKNLRYTSKHWFKCHRQCKGCQFGMVSFRGMTLYSLSKHINLCLLCTIVLKALHRVSLGVGFLHNFTNARDYYNKDTMKIVSILSGVINLFADEKPDAKDLWNTHSYET